MTHDSADRRDSPESAHRAHGGLARPGAAAIAVGDVIAAKYRITSIIGKGGMGVVVAAEHLQLRETVALKFLLHEGDDGQAFRARFVREAQVSAKLRGEHVARLMDFGAPEHGPPFIVMEYLAGTDLREVLARRGRLPTEIALDYLAQACEGVAEAHALGVVHRDLKPSNLFLCKRLDGSDLLKVLDFGVSKQRSGDDDEITSAGVVLGSPRYMAPEQLRSSIDVDARADVWSLGAIFYEMLAGRPPFRADSTPALCALILGKDPPPSLRDLAPDVDPAVERAILRCLERDRDARTPDVASLLVELADATDVPWLRGAAARTAAVLERRSQRADTNPAFSPSTPMVAYTSSPRGSTSGISTATAPPRSAGTSGPVVAPRSASAAESPRRSPLVFAAMLLIVAAGVGATVLLTRSPGAPAAAVPAVPAKTGETPAASTIASSPAAAVTSSEAAPARPVAEPPGPGSAQPGVSAPIRASARPAAGVAKRPASPAPEPAPAPTTKPSRPLDDRF